MNDGLSNSFWASTSLADAAIRERAREAEVAQPYVALVVNQNVSRLEVAVDDVGRVKLFEGAKQVVEDDDEVVLFELTRVASLDKLS